MKNDIQKTAKNIDKSAILSSEDVKNLLQKNEVLSHENSELNDENSRLKMSLEDAHKKIAWFGEQIKLGKQKRFGKSSEKIAKQEEIIFNADEGLVATEEETPKPIAETESITYTRRKNTGRKIDTSLLPRYQQIHDLSEYEKICTTCQSALHKIRDDISEQLEIIPQQVYVIEHIHPQYGCRHCETVKSAEKMLSPIPKSMAGASLISNVIVSKYDHHLPLYRQSKIFKSSGMDIPDNTLGNWVMQSGEALRVMDDALQDEINKATYLQVDESPIKIVDPEKKAYMWVYLSPLPNHTLIRFRFDLSRSGTVVENDLNDFSGLLQNDGYSGYTGLRNKSDVIPFGCLAHGRRKFIDVIKITSNTTAGKAHEAVSYFLGLYKIEKEAREQKLNFAERKELRQREAKPILEKFHQWLVKSRNQVPPKSGIATAITYMLKQWPYLEKYVDYGEVEIDDNWVENAIRPLALGRKNWLFVAHEESAQIAALFYSLIQSAKMNHLDPRIYLHYLLTQTHTLRKKEINACDLLPHRIDRELLQKFAEAEYQKSKNLFAAFTVE